MKKLLCLILAAAVALSLFCCHSSPADDTTQTSIPDTTVPETTMPETTAPQPTESTAAPHSDLCPEGYDVDEILTYFNEVVLQMEYTDGTGDPTLVQKWLQPIRYRIDGEATEEDLRVLEELFDGLNQIPGFPGIGPAEEDWEVNLTLSFLDPEAFRENFSDAVQGEDAWGAAQFWYYTDTCELYTARIGYRTDLDQTVRSSILLEEVINVLGISDSELRSDSIVYQYPNESLALSDMDWLILKLLYHPAIECGMDAEDCKAVLEQLCH